MVTWQDRDPFTYDGLEPEEEPEHEPRWMRTALEVAGWTLAAALILVLARIAISVGGGF